jgi:hypothetical protein
MALTAAAVSVAALVILGPWALVALVIGTVLVIRAPGRRTLVASLILASVSTGLALLLMTGSSEDFQTGILVFALTSGAATAFSALGLRRLGRSDPGPAGK